VITAVVVGIIGFVVLVIAAMFFVACERAEKRSYGVDYSNAREHAIYIAENESDPNKFIQWQITIRAMYCSCTEKKWLG